MGIKGHDAVNHLIIMREFSWQLLQGDLFPRWLIHAESGFGSPIITYFPMLHYYTGIIFYPLNRLDAVLSLPEGYLALYSNATLAIALSGIFMFRYLLQLADEKTAFLCAVLYMLMPYHLGVDLYYRFALAELWLLALAPLFLYYNDRSSTYGTALTAAALVFAHPLTAPFILAIAIAKNIMERRSGLFLPILMGVGIAAIYWVPAVLNSGLISSQLGIGYYNYAEHFLDFTHASIPFSAIAIFLLLITLPSLHKNLLWGAIIIASLFMCIGASAFLWETITPLQQLSFPWRFLLFASLAACIILRHSAIIRRNLIPVIIIALALNIPFITAINSENPAKYLDHHTITVDDYRPRTVPQEMVITGEHKDLAKLRNIKFPRLDVIIRPNKIIAVSDYAGEFLIPQFYFPNWKSHHEITPDKKTGLMKIRFKKPGIALIEYKADSNQRTGWYISLFSVIALYALNRLTRNRHKIY